MKSLGVNYRVELEKEELLIIKIALTDRIKKELEITEIENVVTFEKEYSKYLNILDTIAELQSGNNKNEYIRTLISTNIKNKISNG